MEALAATVVLAVGVLGTLAVFPQALNTSRRSSETLTLRELAVERAETLRSLPFDHADLAIGVHPIQQTDSVGAGYYPVAGFPQAYSVRWVVSAGPTDGAGVADPNLKTVQVDATHRIRYTNTGNQIPNATGQRSRIQFYVSRGP